MDVVFSKNARAVQLSDVTIDEFRNVLRVGDKDRILIVLPDNGEIALARVDGRLIIVLKLHKGRDLVFNLMSMAEARLIKFESHSSDLMEMMNDLFKKVLKNHKRSAYAEVSVMHNISYAAAVPLTRWNFLDETQWDNEHS